MEEKKVKVGQIVGIIVLVALLVVAFWVGNIVRKVLILEDLSQKVESQNAKTNTYSKIIKQDQILESYRKDDTVKTISRNETENTSSILIMCGEEGKIETGNIKSAILYVEKDGEKIAYKFDSDNMVGKFETVTDYTDISADPAITAKAQIANNSKISSEKLEGKDCYVIEQSYPKSEDIVTLDFEEGMKKAKLYVEKETGLPIKEIMIYEDGHEDVKTYEYSFETVTDKDMKAPEGYKEVAR